MADHQGLSSPANLYKQRAAACLQPSAPHPSPGGSVIGEASLVSGFQPL